MTDTRVFTLTLPGTNVFWTPQPSPVFFERRSDGSLRPILGPADVALAAFPDGPMPARGELDAWSFESCDRTLFLRSVC